MGQSTPLPAKKVSAEHEEVTPTATDAESEPRPAARRRSRRFVSTAARSRRTARPAPEGDAPEAAVTEPAGPPDAVEGALGGAAPLELPTFQVEAIEPVDRPPARRAPDDGGPHAIRHDVALDESQIDPDVQKVVRRLVRHGYEAYLVGGCVRDLLLGRRPKDFDVATSARPEQVRDLFRNSRIIGRRFRLVHVLFHGGKVIEVATFRRNPKEEGDFGSELLIRADNVFGVAHEDASRRDFTINALFYDLEARQILDWVGGMADVERRVVHTIGDPETRFREDPVRILRALKFAGRLDLGITPDVYDAIVMCREALALAARPRLSEEILRLLRGGRARRTIYLAWETGVLDVLLPELAALLYDSGEADGARARLFRLLDHVDRRTEESGPLDDTVLWTLLLLEPMKEASDGVRDRAAAIAEFLEPVIERLAISRRYADGMRRIVAILPRLTSGRAGRFARTELFQLALDVATAEVVARGASTAAVDELRALAAPPPQQRPRGRG
jgi:poly(A) polymerase